MPSDHSQTQREGPGLKRALTLPLLTLYGLGVTLGAGIYVLVGAVAGEAGLYAPVSFLLAALVVGITAMSYAELATRFPVSAGEAAYVQAGFGIRQLTLLVGLLVALSGIVSSAAVAIGAGAYLSGVTGLPVGWLAIATVLAMGALAAWGITESVTAAAIVTVVEMCGLLLVIGWGFGGPSEAVASPGEFIPAIGGEHWIGIGGASILAFFAFIGFEDMANVAEEVKNPVRTYPRALLLTLVITTLLYILTVVSVMMKVPVEELSGSAAPLMLAFKDAPSIYRDAFSVIAVVATVNGILIQMIMASRVIYGLADRGHLPRLLAYVSPSTRTPLAATAFVVLAVIALSWGFPIEVLAERTSQIVLFIFVLVNLALLRLKQRGEGAAGDHFAVPIAVPIAGAITCAILLAVGLV